ncbi:SDR family NAD(P)-dependent oxidoreductase [Vibrio penaeicida]|uniref:SDR family NAD(P)-dependent oxidoreductase n=1 Tax=Vibrio penaeicida TaxID=104609 RepID=UPI000CEA1078|nr:SDR family oxidoreductase [Vibrio penaeicida]
MQNVLVTGATRGLGLSIARLLKTEGYNVIATGRKLTPELKESIEDDSASGNIHFHAFDMKNTSEIHEFVKTLTKEHGHFYGLVNNAALGHDGVLATMHDSQIEELVQVNVLSAILLTKYMSRSMLLNRKGRVINVSSIIASTGFNGLSVYGATKAALSGFTRSLSRELGKSRITVNTIAPGYMETDMTSGLQGEKLKSIKRRSPLGKLAGVDDVAHSVSFLLSDKAVSMTGSTVTVDAGSTA